MVRAPRHPYMGYMRLRLASYNLHKCLGTDRRRDPGRVVDVINSVDAHVIALQEADMRMGPRPAALPHRMVEQATDFAVLPLARNDISIGWHGQAILVHRDIEVTATERIELPGLEPRGAVMAELELPSGPLRVVGVHLGLLRPYRLRQMRAIRIAIAARTSMPTAILGDFNEWSPDRGMEPLTDAFRVHAPGRSFHASRPIAALDRVALSRELLLDDAGVVETPLARRASDHLPIWAEVAAETVPA